MTLNHLEHYKVKDTLYVYYYCPWVPKFHSISLYDHVVIFELQAILRMCAPNGSDNCLKLCKYWCASKLNPLSIFIVLSLKIN